MAIPDWVLRAMEKQLDAELAEALRDIMPTLEFLKGLEEQRKSKAASSTGSKRKGRKSIAKRTERRRKTT